MNANKQLWMITNKCMKISLLWAI